MRHHTMIILYRYKGYCIIQSIPIHLNAIFLYLCSSISIDKELISNKMTDKIAEMSNLKQVLQLHKSGTSNRSIALQLGLYKETVKKHIRQFKTLSFFRGRGIKIVVPNNPKSSVINFVFFGGTKQGRIGQNCTFVTSF